MDPSRLVDEITVWLREQVGEANASGLVCGLSGGVDSAVVAVLCKRAVGQDTLALAMPCHSDPCDKEYAAELAAQMELNLREIALDGIYDALVELLPEGNDLARANLKPRLRMITLYFVANTRNYLVVGTGNKSEAMVGYFTKHGDGGVDLLPIGGLLKKEVIQLARHLGIPQDIISRPPSAGLWPGQTDEAELGLSYAELDSVLEALEDGREPEASPAAVKRIRKLMVASEHKRRPPAIFERNELL